LLEAGVDLLLFAGGDGTARDIIAAIGTSLPVLGIPAGVKIHSAVFGITPAHAGEIAAEFLRGQRSRLREAEVVDLDEASYRQGSVITRLYGYLRVPYSRLHVQNQKAPTPDSEAAQAGAIAAEVIERMLPGKPTILGPGTTPRAVAERLGLPKTLVGLDVITPQSVIALDVGEAQLLELLASQPASLVITPIGGQGFLFGRGNQPLSPAVLRKIGKENTLVISLPGKIAALRGRPLRIDSGDPRVDRQWAGYIEVITGYHERIMYRVEG
jgi:predicted polyphosphate/ATP-dependent NAD kinase